MASPSSDGLAGSRSTIASGLTPQRVTSTQRRSATVVRTAGTDRRPDPRSWSPTPTSRTSAPARPPGSTAVGGICLCFQRLNHVGDLRGEVGQVEAAQAVDGEFDAAAVTSVDLQGQVAVPGPQP